MFKRWWKFETKIQGSQGPSPSFGSFTSLDRSYEVRLKMMGRWHWSAWPVIIKLFNECTLDGAIYTVCGKTWKKHVYSAAVLLSRFWPKESDFLNLMNRKLTRVIGVFILICCSLDGMRWDRESDLLTWRAPGHKAYSWICLPLRRFM